MNKTEIPSAKDYFLGNTYISDEEHHVELANLLIEFTKLHLKAQLEAILAKATLTREPDSFGLFVDKESIENAYNINENVK